METQQKNDIVPALYENIHADFKSIIAMDPWIKAFKKRLKKGRATQLDIDTYAGYLGKAAAKALTRGLSEENLPGGKNLLEHCETHDRTTAERGKHNGQ
ncbi:MAG: hypothetical protein ACOX4I_00745 [Anaerovoracaceae bacterium]|jgi:hypothetical protein